YATEKSLDNLITVLQAQSLSKPIAQLFWQLIIQDQYVDFSKLFASIDQGYDHNEEAKELMAEYTIIRKNILSVKKPLRSESDWCRVYDIWARGV
ncbi:uncharacterized protein BT62DRAFT_885778, partial [Guyanagaster necrorhizus]